MEERPASRGLRSVTLWRDLRFEAEDYFASVFVSLPPRVQAKRDDPKTIVTPEREAFKT